MTLDAAMLTKLTKLPKSVGMYCFACQMEELKQTLILKQTQEKLTVMKSELELIGGVHQAQCLSYERKAEDLKQQILQLELEHTAIQTLQSQTAFQLKKAETHVSVSSTNSKILTEELAMAKQSYESEKTCWLTERSQLFDQIARIRPSTSSSSSTTTTSAKWLQDKLTCPLSHLPITNPVVLVPIPLKTPEKKSDEFGLVTYQKEAAEEYLKHLKDKNLSSSCSSQSVRTVREPVTGVECDELVMLSNVAVKQLLGDNGDISLSSSSCIEGKAHMSRFAGLESLNQDGKKTQKKKKKKVQNSPKRPPGL